MFNFVKEILVAFSFFTIIPTDQENSEKYIKETCKYFVFIGFTIGIMSSILFLVIEYLTSYKIAIFAIIVFSSVITGFLHEDGFCDTIDAFGVGGRTKNQILEIMKDSRIGTYAQVSISLVILGRYIFLTEFPREILLGIIILVQTLSRFAAITILNTHKYVEEQDKVRIVIHKLSFISLFVSLIFVFFALCLIPIKFWIPIISFTFIVRYFYGKLITSKIGGFTGDIIGACVIISEFAIYIATVFTFYFI